MRVRRTRAEGGRGDNTEERAGAARNCGVAADRGREGRYGESANLQQTYFVLRMDARHMGAAPRSSSSLKERVLQIVKQDILDSRNQMMAQAEDWNANAGGARKGYAVMRSPPSTACAR